MQLICKYSFIADDLIKHDFEKNLPRSMDYRRVLPLKIYFLSTYWVKHDEMSEKLY